MTKKTLLALAFAAFVAGEAFAESNSLWSVGGGFIFDAGVSAVDTSQRVPGIGVIRNEFNFVQIGLGGWVFVDARFAELSIALFGGPSMWRADFLGVVDEEWGSFFAMDFSLLGKWPIALRQTTAFLALGIGYTLAFSSNVEGERYPDSPSDLNVFRVQFGFGFDIDLSERLFFRTSYLGFIRFRSRYFREFAQELESFLNVGAETFGGGATVKIGVGFRL